MKTITPETITNLLISLRKILIFEDMEHFKLFAMSHSHTGEKEENAWLKTAAGIAWDYVKDEK